MVHLPLSNFRVARHVVHVDSEHQSPEIRTSEEALNPSLNTQTYAVQHYQNKCVVMEHKKMTTLYVISIIIIIKKGCIAPVAIRN